MNTKRTPHTNESMHIAQLSKLTNVPYETLRVWSKKGFIHRKQMPKTNIINTT